MLQLETLVQGERILENAGPTRIAATHPDATQCSHRRQRRDAVLRGNCAHRQLSSLGRLIPAALLEIDPRQPRPRIADVEVLVPFQSRGNDLLQSRDRRVIQAHLTAAGSKHPLGNGYIAFFAVRGELDRSLSEKLHTAVGVAGHQFDATEHHARSPGNVVGTHILGELHSLPDRFESRSAPPRQHLVGSPRIHCICQLGGRTHLAQDGNALFNRFGGSLGVR